MALVSMRQLLDEAAKGGYGVGAFNVNNMEQIQAIMEAARETQSPVIIQASRGARAYTNDRFLWHLMQAAVELYPEIPVSLHLDHGNSPETCISAIELGFTSVMMDGSLEADGKTPASYEYNLAVTKEVVAYAHARGVTVEGELGTLGGIEDGHGSGEVHLTDPDQAVDFVEQTGLDALAVAIGTSHGAYKFAQEPTGDVLKMDLIMEIHRRLPETHLVMHGSSSVPRELVETVNRYGGALKPAWGVPVREIQTGIRHGVRKINVDTDSRLAITGAIRKVFVESPEKFDPRDYLKPARAAMQALIAERMRDFGQAGHAGDYEAKSIEEMRASYAAGRVAVDAGAVLVALDEALAELEPAARPAAAAPTLAALAAPALDLDEDALAAATRRGLLMAAAGGDPKAHVGPGSPAVLETAADLADDGLGTPLARAIGELAALPVAASLAREAALAVAADEALAVEGLALLLLASAVAGEG